MSTISACSTNLASHILNDCNDKYGKGVEATAYIYSRDDLDWSGITIDTKITSLPLSSGKKGFYLKMPAKLPYDGIKIEQQDVNYGEDYTKTVPIALLADSQANSKNVSALVRGKYVVVLESSIKGTNGDQSFIVFGLEQGATATGMTLDKYSDDSVGGWLGSLVEESASYPQIFLDAGGYDTTKALLEASVADEGSDEESEDTDENATL